ncbi:hypothetical protein D046_8338A, partial [Vibrio parahaemolyticus V-223/04]
MGGFGDIITRCSGVAVSQRDDAAHRCR